MVVWVDSKVPNHSIAPREASIVGYFAATGLLWTLSHGCCWHVNAHLLLAGATKERDLALAAPKLSFEYDMILMRL